MSYFQGPVIQFISNKEQMQSIPQREEAGNKSSNWKGKMPVRKYVKYQNGLLYASVNKCSIYVVVVVKAYKTICLFLVARMQNKIVIWR